MFFKYRAKVSVVIPRKTALITITKIVYEEFIRIA